MSPHRAIVKDRNGNYMVIAAMLSVDSKSKERRIFIVNKSIPECSSFMDMLKVAHSMTTKHNSNILAKYVIDSIPNEGNTYRVTRYMEEGSYVLEDNYHLQSYCLKASLYDFCRREGYEIIENM